ncbi:MAG: hypothetical protein QM681_03690 [Novosphingobium sp.]
MSKATARGMSINMIGHAHGTYLMQKRKFNVMDGDHHISSNDLTAHRHSVRMFTNLNDQFSAVNTWSGSQGWHERRNQIRSAGAGHAGTVLGTV